MGKGSDREETTVDNRQMSRVRLARRLATLVLAFTAPLMMGGCPQIRNTAVDAVETGMRDVLNTALDLYFENWRSHDTR